MDKAVRILVLSVVALSVAHQGIAETADEAYRLAVGLHNMPIYEDAAAKLKAFTETYPEDERLGMVFYRLGDCQVQLKQHEKALASFKTVVEKYPQSLSAGEALFRVGELSQFLGDDATAVAIYARFLTEYPEHELIPLVKEKERSVAVAALYSKIESDVDATLAAAAKLCSRKDKVGEEALFVTSSLRFNKGDHEATVKASQELVTRFPESTHADEARLNAANSLVALGRLEECLVQLAGVKATRLDEVSYLRGSVLGKQKVPDKAVAAYQDVVANHPKSRYRPYALFELGMLGQAAAWPRLLTEYPKGDLADEVRYREAVRLTGENKTEEALTLLDAMAKKTARRKDADLLKAELQSGADLAGAMALVTSLERQKVKPARLSRARYAVALAALEQGKPADALPQLAAILKDATSKELHADCLYRAGLAQEKLKQPAPAQASYQKLVTQYPADRLTPFALLRMAALQVDAQPATALASLQKILADYPKFAHRAQAEDLIADISYRRAWDAYEAKQHAAAAALFDPLRKHATYGAESVYLAGVCYRNADKLPEAERCLAFLLKTYPKYTFAGDARELLGELLSAQKKWQDAATHYGSYAGTIEDAKARAAVELKQGMALYQLSQSARARESLLYASENGEPAVKARALFFLGELLLMQKKHAEAKDYFLKVGLLYRHDELTPASLLEAAKCLKATGDATQCKTVLERLKKEFPQSPHAKEAGEMLGQL